MHAAPAKRPETRRRPDNASTRPACCCSVRPMLHRTDTRHKAHSRSTAARSSPANCASACLRRRACRPDETCRARHGKHAAPHRSAAGFFGSSRIAISCVHPARESTPAWQTPTDPPQSKQPFAIDAARRRLLLHAQRSRRTCRLPQPKPRSPSQITDEPQDMRDSHLSHSGMTRPPHNHILTPTLIESHTLLRQFISRPTTNPLLLCVSVRANSDDREAHAFPPTTRVSDRRTTSKDTLVDEKRETRHRICP